jgi:hypothetical protein
MAHEAAREDSCHLPAPQDSFSALADVRSLPGKDAPAGFRESWRASIFRRAVFTFRRLLFQNSRLHPRSVKSAIVFSLMVDGSPSRGCRIFGRSRPATASYHNHHQQERQLGLP